MVLLKVITSVLSSIDRSQKRNKWVDEICQSVAGQGIERIKVVYDLTKQETGLSSVCCMQFDKTSIWLSGTDSLIQVLRADSDNPQIVNGIQLSQTEEADGSLIILTNTRITTMRVCEELEVMIGDVSEHLVAFSLDYPTLVPFLLASMESDIVEVL